MTALTATKTITTGRIYTRAMLVKLKINLFGNTIQLPKEIVQEFASTHGISAEDAKKFHKLSQHKIDPIHLAQVRQSAGALRHMHIYLTSPWSDEGARILSVNGHDRYKKDMRPLLDAHECNVKFFVKDVYADAMHDAKVALNGLAKYIDYPSVEAIRHEFSCGITYRELPRSGDFRCDLDSDDVAAIIAGNTKDDLEQLERAARDGWEKGAVLIKNMAERLEAFVRVEFKDPSTGKTKVREENGFHKTLVTNIEDYLAILPGLNFTEDERLNKLAEEIRNTLCRYSAGDLKNDDAARETTLEAAQEILNKMSAYI